MAYPGFRNIYRKPIDTTNHTEFGILLAMLKSMNDSLRKNGYPYVVEIEGGLARQVMVHHIVTTTPVQQLRQTPLWDHLEYKPLIDPDLDFVIYHHREIEEEKDEKNGAPLRRAVEIIKASVTGWILNENIETKQIRIAKKGGLGKTREDLIRSRDLTIDECTLSVEGGQLVLNYSDKCRRDTVLCRGIICTGSPTLVRVDNGEIVYLSLAIVRLIRFLIEGKVKEIYLPQKMIDVVKQESKSAMHLMPQILILCKRYEHLPTYQKNLMEALNYFGFTTIKSFSAYVKKLEDTFQKENGKPFQFGERSIDEILDARIARINQQDEGRQERQAQRDRCDHRGKIMTPLEGKDKGLFRWTCACGMFKLTAKPDYDSKPIPIQMVPSNRDLISAELKSKEDFVAF